MLEVILDTETTGLSTKEKHKIVEIGCIELSNQIPTNRIFHEYINPKRLVSEEAYKVHGYSDKFLSDKKTFAEIAESFQDFIKDKKLKKLQLSVEVKKKQSNFIIKNNFKDNSVKKNVKKVIEKILLNA